MVGLVGCVKSKLAIPAPAYQLYSSPLFRGSRRWVEQTCDRWFILSALHGLVRPDDVLAPYDEELASASARTRREWSEKVLQQLQETLEDIQGIHVEIHAGSPYRDHGLITGLTSRQATISVPSAGLSLGQQLAFYAAGPGALTSSTPREPSEHRTHPAPRPRSHADTVGVQSSKYAPLTRLLVMSTTPLTVAFPEVEKILGASLPASARQHRPWWSNGTSHSQANSWLSEGWQVASVDMHAGQVTFYKDHR